MSKKIEEIEIDKIIQSENSRMKYERDELSELMSSLRSSGLLQPIGVHPDQAGGDHYHVVYGNRRFMAARKLGWKTIPCIVIKDIQEDEFLIKNLTENIQRKNLSLPEEGRFFLMLRGQGLTAQEIAARIGVSVKHVEQAVSAFQLIPKEFRAHVKQQGRGTPQKGHIPASAALSIIQSGGRLQKDEISDLLEKVKSGELNARKVGEVTRLVRAGYTVKKALTQVETVRPVSITIPMKLKVIDRLEKKHGVSIFNIIQDILRESDELEIDKAWKDISNKGIRMNESKEDEEDSA